MIYLLHGMSQKPKKMADGGLTSGTLDPNISNQGQGGSVQNPGLISNLTPQSNFQAQLAPTTMVNYTPAINSGLGAVNGAISGEQGLLPAFQANANGQGPLQTQLATATGNNIASQASLLGSARGASSNPGLMARQIGQAGGAQMTGLVGNQATAQLGAQQNLAGLYGNIANQGGSLFGTSANAANAQNTNLVNNYSQAQGTNAQTAATNAQGQRTMLGNLANSGSSLISAFMAEGGEVPSSKELECYAFGGSSGDPTDSFVDTGNEGVAANGDQSIDPQSNPEESGNGPKSFAGKNLSGSGSGGNQSTATLKEDSIQFRAPQMYASGGAKVPGKAKVSGDSEKNDTVHALLSPGEIVVPRTSAQDPDKAAAFAYGVAMKSRNKGKK